MDSINLLGAAIISRILDSAAHQHLGSNSGMDDFRRIAELTTVCKFWRDCMPPYATETLIVERSAIRHTNTSSNGQPFHSHKWATNLSFILAMSRQNRTKEMRVVMFDPYPSKLLLTSALAALNILDTPWTGIEHLFFLGQGVHTAVREDEEADETTNVYAKVSLLLSTLPNISYVRYYLYDKVGFSPGILNIGDRYSSFYLNLQRTLLARATKLQCLLPFPSYDLLNFSGTLSCLDLNINVVKDLGCAALFNPATLQTLRLYELTAAKDPWYLFTSDCRGNLTFPCLHSLIVLYDPSQVEPSPAVYSTDGLTITFPALERLYIADSTRHVLEFYKLFVGVRQSRTNFLEPVNRLQHIDPHLLTFTQAFSIFARDQVCQPTQLLPRHHVTHLYKAPSMATKAVLTNFTFPFPALTRWYNLRVLDFRTDVATLPELTRLLSQLPKLWYLSIVCLTMDHRDVTSWQWDRSTIEDEARQIPMVDDLEPVNTKLQSLHFRSDRFIDIEGLAELTKWLPSLLELTVLNFYVDEMREELKNVNREDVEVKEFPHRN